MQLNPLYPKSNFIILSRFTLVETSLIFKIRSNNFALRIRIHAQYNIKQIITLIVCLIYYLYYMQTFYLY
jgi:hypothetical protein